MKRRTSITAALVTGLMLVVACNTVQAAGLGISPPSFTIEDAMRGSEYECEIAVSYLSEEDTDYEFSALGPGREWISFYRAEDPLTPLTNYLFTWENVPGSESESCLKALKDVLHIEWAEGAEIQKSEDNTTIHIVAERHSATITLDATNGTATLQTSSGGIHDLSAKRVGDTQKLYVSTIWIKGLLICRWNEVPGNDSERLIRYLREDLLLGWAGTAEIQKEDNTAIRVVKGDNFAVITLDLHNETAILTTSDGRTIKLGAKQEEDGTIKILNRHTQQRIIVSIRVPDDAQNKVYDTTIYIKSIPPEATAGAGAMAHSVVRMKVDATIAVTGTQILKGTVKDITAAETEVEYPLRIFVTFQNEGNVVATPIVSCTITKNGTLVDSLEHDETGIKPYKTGTITVAWNTSGQEPGDYNVSVNVSLAGEHIATKVLPFTILPRGALTRKGELSSLYIDGEPQVNRIIKIIAEFENTGAIDTTASFVGEVYCNDEFIDIVESREKLVTVGETYKIVSYYKITMHGDYLISGMVLYEGRETEAKDVSFIVLEP